MAEVFYEGWQLQCCGDPFEIGATVLWTATEPKNDPRWLTEAGDIDWYEDHHGSETHSLQGVVQRIQAVWRDYERERPGSQMWLPVPGTYSARDVRAADGREKEDLPERCFEGYLVTLKLFAQPHPIPAK